MTQLQKNFSFGNTRPCNKIKTWWVATRLHTVKTFEIKKMPQKWTNTPKKRKKNEMLMRNYAYSLHRSPEPLAFLSYFWINFNQFSATCSVSLQLSFWLVLSFLSALTGSFEQICWFITKLEQFQLSIHCGIFFHLEQPLTSPQPRKKRYYPLLAVKTMEMLPFREIVFVVIPKTFLLFQLIAYRKASELGWATATAESLCETCF